MVCKNCGKEVPDGADYCEACGAPLEEPIVLKVTKDDIKKAEKEEKQRAKERAKEYAKHQSKQNIEKPVVSAKKVEADTSKWFDVAGYINTVKADRSVQLILLGALILYIAPFLNWIHEKLFDVKRAANLFEMGMTSKMVGEDGTVLALGSKLLFVYGILVMLSCLVIIAFSASDFIRPIRKFSDDARIRLIPLAIVLVVFALVYINKPYTEALDAINDNLTLAKQIGTADNYDGGKGLGPVVYLIGLGICAFGTWKDIKQRKSGS